MPVIPPTVIVGPSGSGKSRSLINLPKERTAILNTQLKVLPFKTDKPFASNKLIKTKAEFDAEFNRVSKSPDFDFIVIEDFSRYLINLVSYAKVAASGWDVWNLVYAETYKFLTDLSAIENKFAFVLTADEIIRIDNPNGTGRNERRIITAGKALEKLSIESFFTTVLFTERITPADGKSPMTYNFRTNADSTSSCKSPEGMFKENLIPNDLMFVAKAIKNYFPQECEKVNLNLSTPISFEPPR